MRSLFSQQSKKGQVNNIAPAVLALTFAAVVLVFGIIMLQSLRDTQEGAVSETIANESIVDSVGVYNFTTTHNSTLRVGNLPGFGYGSISISSITNFSGNPLGTGNYTLYNDGNIIAISTGFITNFTSVNLSYTGTHGGIAYDAGNRTTFGLGTFADFWEIIVLAIVITVIIGLLLVIFGGRRTR